MYFDEVVYTSDLLKTYILQNICFCAQTLSIRQLGWTMAYSI